MFTALSFALSFVGGLHPSYRLDFEITMVSIEPQSDTASYEQTIERSEYDARSKAKRLVFLKGAEKSILIFAKDEMSVENIHPDGSRQSKTFPTSKLPKTPEKLIGFLSGQEGDLEVKQLPHTRQRKRRRRLRESSA